MQDLIIIKQLPQIEENLKSVAIEIDKKVENAKGLICTEENKQIIKNIRTAMNKELLDFETQRKAVKEQILAPYMKFEEIYKECISEKYKTADKELKTKIDTIEKEQKKKLEEEARNYFEEYKTNKKIEFITFENVGLKIGVSDNPTKLKKQITAFIDKVADDLNLINTQANQAEILVEYKKHLNVSRAITEVMDRKKALIEIEKQRVENNLEKEKQDIQQKMQQLANDVKVPEVSQEKTYTITFTVTGTAPRLKKLKDYLLREGYQYE